MEIISNDWYTDVVDQSMYTNYCLYKWTKRDQAKQN